VILSLALAGLFVQDCSHGFRRSQEFRAGQVIYSEENFFDSACEEASVVTRSYGAYVLGAEIGSGREIDFTFAKVMLVPKNEEVAEAYRARRLCGRADWVAGEETEITGLRCDFLGNGAAFPVPALGDRRYGLVKTQREALWFGRLSPERDGMSPGRRPLILDPLPYRPQAD
jgi:hypothetical protein